VAVMSFLMCFLSVVFRRDSLGLSQFGVAYTA